jgi:hypothetical protein
MISSDATSSRSPKKTSKWLFFGIAFCIGIAVVVVGPPGALVNIIFFPSDRNVKELLAKAGGADEVCKEADQIFQKYGVTNQTFFFDDMLKDYPAVNALGKVDYIMPDEPLISQRAYIKIRVGNVHWDGYMMYIADTNFDYKFEMGRDVLEVVKNRVYVTK